MEAIETPRPTNPHNVLSTLLSPLASRQCQIRPLQQGRVGQPPEIVTASVSHKREARNSPEGDGGNFGQNPEGGTASVYRKLYTTKSGYLTFDPCGMSTINWRTLYQE